MSSSKQLKRVLIANRGEICRRIASTAQKLGIETVAIKEKGQFPKAYLAELIDHWIEVENETTSTYLDMDFLITNAVKLQCDAVHPGFGFLSENSDFAARVQYSGLTWIGPSPESIRLMASKSEASRVAEKCGVPTIPGVKKLKIPNMESGDFDALESFTQKSGFPVLLKAAYGGGGKGMRRVTEPEQLKEAAIRAASEAQASFGNGELICEKYIENARHVEVQVLADSYGNVRVLSDRDCSVQRRHQKIIEEAPAPLIDDATRKAMHVAASNLSKEVGYLSAGTVEFILEWDQKKKRCSDFYFLEMNTRLQVEHPVTEEILDLDLVEQQFKIAAGESIASMPLDIAPKGHAIEARIYAENPYNDFFPSPGPVQLFAPLKNSSLRWEIGVDGIDSVSDRFDPMIAKLVATGTDRNLAIQNLKEGLARTHLICESNNIPFLLKVLNSTEFKNVEMTTRWIDQKPQELFEEHALEQTDEHQALLGLSETLLQSNSSSNFLPASRLAQSQQAIFSTSALRSCLLSSEGTTTFNSHDGSIVQFCLSSWPHSQKIDLAVCESKFGKVASVLKGSTRFSRQDRAFYLSEFEKMHQEEGGFLAPVPGKVIKILKAASDQVVKNEVVFVLESMKMEFEVRAENSGKIGVINVSEGDQVASGQALASLEEE